MILLRIYRFTRYFLSSRHRKGHGIHSPFVYDIVTRVFRNKIDTDIVFNIEKIRKKLISDHRVVNMRDLGSGKERRETSIRKVSEIIRYSSVPQKYGVLLANLSNEFGKPAIIELGTSLGISTMYLAAFSPESIVYTIEGCTATGEIAKENFREAGLENINIMNGSFDEMLPVIVDKIKNPGLVFIDGNHRKLPLIKYFRQLAEISSSRTVIIIDDINTTPEMAEAWKEIKNNKKVSFTIDIFRMGLVFFRQGMTPRDYLIRY